ncbi:MAG TPA: cytochrome c-type biogenesis protein [Roseiarcus sp.]|nr:cytochrome c-type biogenesis protein [Roseiarcus sp.]
MTIRPAALAFTLALAMTNSAWAVQPGEMLTDPQLEGRARALSAELRCMVCQNQSIDDSDAPLAHDIRVLIRERIAAGQSDEAVKAFLVSRYGDFILLKPPLKTSTWLLWAGPPLILLFGAAFVVANLRKRQGRPLSPPPLDDAEEARVAALLKGEDG